MFPDHITLSVEQMPADYETLLLTLVIGVISALAIVVTGRWSARAVESAAVAAAASEQLSRFHDSIHVLVSDIACVAPSERLTYKFTSLRTKLAILLNEMDPRQKAMLTLLEAPLGETDTDFEGWQAAIVRLARDYYSSLNTVAQRQHV